MYLCVQTFTPTIPSRQQPVTKMEHHFSLTGKQDSLTAALVIQCNSEQGNSTEKRLGFDMQYQAKEKPNCACRQKSQQLIVPTIVKGKTSGVSRETVILQRGLERLTATTRRATADGLHVVDVRGDGACMFRAVCVSDTGSDIDHLLLREATIGYMRGNAADFIPYLNDEDLPFSEYLDRISRPNQQVGECALNAISNVLGKQVKVYFGDCEPNSYKPKWSDSDRLINVLYHDLTLSNNGHYMALVYSNSPRNTSVIGTSQSLYLPKH